MVDYSDSAFNRLRLEIYRFILSCQIKHDKIHYRYTPQPFCDILVSAAVKILLETRKTAP